MSEEKNVPYSWFMYVVLCVVILFLIMAIVAQFKTVAPAITISLFTLLSFIGIHFVGDACFDPTDRYQDMWSF